MLRFWILPAPIVLGRANRIGYLRALASRRPHCTRAMLSPGYTPQVNMR
jgi:hypothetical protein